MDSDEKMAKFLEIDVGFYRCLLRKFNSKYHNEDKVMKFKDHKYGYQAAEYLNNRFIVIRKLLNEN